MCIRDRIITVYLIGQFKPWSDMISFHCSEMISYHFTGIIFSHGFITLISTNNNYVIGNSNWTELSTILGVIGREISTRPSAKRKADLKFRAPLLPELYNMKSNYYLIVTITKFEKNMTVVLNPLICWYIQLLTAGLKYRSQVRSGHRSGCRSGHRSGQVAGQVRSGQ